MGAYTKLTMVLLVDRLIIGVCCHERRQHYFARLDEGTLDHGILDSTFALLLLSCGGDLLRLCRIVAEGGPHITFFAFGSQFLSGWLRDSQSLHQHRVVDVVALEISFFFLSLVHDFKLVSGFNMFLAFKVAIRVGSDSSI